MTATAPSHRPLDRLSAWWRWRRARPRIELSADVSPGERHQAWLAAMAEWEASRP